MPEGDTIFRVAETLGRALVGEALTEVRLAFGRGEPAREGPATRALVGATPIACRSLGKHLALELDSGHALHLHLGMTGKVTLAPRPADGARGSRASVWLANERVLALVHRPARVELRLPGAPPDARLARLGVDLLDPSADLEAVVARARRLGPLPVGELVLRQDVAAGIGNVVKSESLFLARVSPFELADALDDATLRSLYEVARTILASNVEAAPTSGGGLGGYRWARRTTRLARPGEPAGRLWVYERSGEPCFVCGAPIVMRRQGDAARSTYFCPSCQVCQARGPSSGSLARR